MLAVLFVVVAVAIVVAALWYYSRRGKPRLNVTVEPVEKEGH